VIIWIYNLTSVLKLGSYFIFDKYEATTNLINFLRIYYADCQVQILIGTCVTVIIVVFIITVSLLWMIGDQQEGWLHLTVWCSYNVPWKPVKWIKKAIRENQYTHTHTHTHLWLFLKLDSPYKEKQWFSTVFRRRASIALTYRHAGNKQAEDDGFLREIEIRRMTSFGGDVKPLVACLKILLHVRNLAECERDRPTWR
jgi:hypothetical protein